MSTAKVGDINIYYEVHGSGEPVILIMGYGLRAGHWLDVHDKLASGYRVIVFDNRGTGRSDKPEIPYTANMMAGDVIGMLDVLDIRAANVFGYSMGGMIAQEFALNYPNRLNSLILGGTFFGGPRAVQMSPEAVTSLLGLAKMSEKDKAYALIPWLWNNAFVEDNPSAINWFITTFSEYPTPAHTYLSQANVVMSFNTYDRLPDIKAPTLVITGDEDRIIPHENAKILADRIPNAKLEIIRNSGHGIFISDPTEKVSKIVSDFLRRHAKARANKLI